MLRRLTGLSLSLIAALILAAPAGAASFSYPDFASTTGLTLSGDAVQEGNLLRLTKAEANNAGRVFRTEAIDPQQSFATSFAISMHDSTSLIGSEIKPADGMSFLLQSQGPTAGDGAGGSLGYGGIAPSLAVEFDTWVNGGDPLTEHVGINAEGDTSKHLQCADLGGPTPPCTAALPFPIYGAPVFGWVEYDAGTQHLKVYVSQTPAKPAAPLLDSAVSLAPLGNTAYAGFTAATGAHNAVQDVLSWEFNPPTSTPAAPTTGQPPVPPAGGTAKKPCPTKKAKGKKKGKGKSAGASKAKKGKGKSKGKKCGKGNGKKKGHGKKPGRA